MMPMLKSNSIAVFLICLFYSLVLQAGTVINSYDSFITVEPDGIVLVQEKINITTDGSIQHGIYRDFPTRYQTPTGEVTVQFNAKNAELDNLPTPFLVQELSNGVRIYLGDKDRYLSPGTYTFSLTYTVLGELGYFKDHDELYWNVTGNGWAYPILQATSVVKLPKGAFRHITAYTAYTGNQGSREQYYQATLDDEDQTIRFKTNRALGPNQGLTIVVGWKKGFVKEISFSKVQPNFLLSSLVTGLLIILIYYYWVWNKYGMDDKSRVVIPEYEPPPGFTAAGLRYILKMGYDKKVLASAVLNLAVKNYIKINETKHFLSRTYTLIKQPHFTGSLSSEEQALATSLFLDGDTIELKQQPLLKEMEDTFIRALKNNFKDNYFMINAKYTLIGMSISFALLVLTALINNNLWPSTIVLSFFFVIPLILEKIDSDSLVMKIKIILGLLLFFGIGMILFYLIGEPVFGVKSWIYCLLLFMIIITNLIFASLLKRPTSLGQQLINHTKGFKLFLNATEKDRLNFRNPPDRTPAMFEKYLPYAIALGVEQRWAEQFASILEKANYQPHWYLGSGMGAFNAVAFTSTISDSFSGAISSATTAPGSQSGFSRSGSSGGGGGGGGGGGW